VLDPNAHPLQQAHALAQQLQALGLDAEQASQIALEQVGNSLPPRAAPQPDPEAALHDPDGSLRLQTVFVTGRALPRDALGNAYDTDAQGRQIVLLAGGGIVALSPTDAIRIPGGLATPSAQQLGLLARAVGVAGLLLTPGNAGQNGTDVLLHDNLRYVERPGEFGQLVSRTPGGSWLAEEGRYAGRWEGTQFVLIDVDAGRATTTTTPALPPSNDSPPPLPAWANTPEPLPGYQVAPPAPATPGYQGAPQPSAEDLIIESRQRAQAAWQANPNLRDPNATVGTTDGGPGEWGYSPTRTRGEAYQEQITGVPRGVEYQVNGVWFDGYDPTRNVLVDAKDWVNYPPPNAEFWEDDAVTEARRQLDAAEGTGVRVEWHVASQQAADALNALFQDDRLLSQIKVVVVPKQ
jgi:hypothetical protein